MYAKEPENGEKLAKTNKLSTKLERFCQEYVVDNNGLQAAMRAGYAEKGAGVRASELLKRSKVELRIKELRGELRERAGVTADMVVAELAKIGFAEMGDYIEEGNQITDLKLLPAEKRAVIQSIKKTEYETEWGTRVTTQFTLHSKTTALEMLGKHLGIFSMDNSQRRPAIQINLASE